MDSIGAIIPITTSAQADPLLIPNTSASLRIFADPNTDIVNIIDAQGIIQPIGGINATPIFRADVVIPPAQVLTMGTTPVEIIPAVVNKTIVPILAIAYIDFATTPYATHGNIGLNLQGATKGLFFLPEADFLFSNSTANCIIPFDTPNANSLMLVANSPLQASIEFGNPTAGDSDIVIGVLYTLA